MTVVVVHAHPCEDSYVTALLDPFVPFPVDDGDAIDGAESLVLVHPTWWTSHPAILLAWLGQAVESGLPRVRTLVTVTTLGGSRLANRVAGESGARVIDRVVRMRCVQRPPHHRPALYGPDRSIPQRRAAFLDRVESRIATLVD